jgi:DNA-binding transcriptional ArsR family regulator
MSEQQFLVRDTRLPGHFWADNEIYDVFGAQLGAYAFAVYMALCRRAKNYTGECELSMSQLARDLDVSKATIHQSLARILELGLAMRTREGGPRTTAIYVLADVKSLVDPVHAAQLRLNVPSSSVRIANAKPESSVRVVHGRGHIANATGNEANAAVARRTPYKEEKTLKTEKTNNTCKFCNQTGVREHKGHRGRQFYCHCETGQEMQERDKHGRCRRRACLMLGTGTRSTTARPKPAP